MELHDRLRMARKLAGFKVASEVARVLGIPKPTYYSHENGSRAFESDMALRYAQFFRVSFEWLMTGRGDAKPTKGAAAVENRFRGLHPEDQRELLSYMDFIESRRKQRSDNTG